MISRFTSVWPFFCFRYLSTTFACLIVNVPLIFAQHEYFFDVAFEEELLPKVLKHLTDTYELEFAYEDRQVQDVVITGSYKGNSTDELLHILFSSTSLNYEIVRQKHIILVAKSPLASLKSSINRIQCRVIDAETGYPLSYTSMIGTHSRRGTLADEQGLISFVDQFSSKDSLVISHLGYEPQKIPIAHFRKRIQLLNQNEKLVISLVPNPSTVDNILITDQITVMDFHPIDDKTTIRPSGMRTLPGWGEPDIYQMMGLLPGINGSSSNTGGINIKGGTPDQNLVLWDNIPIYHLSHFFGLFAPFNPYAVHTLDVYANGFGASQGGRVSSVIDIRSEPDSIDEFRLGVGANLLHSYAMLELPHLNDKAALFVSGRRAYSDIVSSTTFNNWFNYTFQAGRQIAERNNQENEDILNLNPQFYYQDITAKWLFKPTQLDELSVSFYQGKDKLEYLQYNPRPETEDMELEAFDILDQSNWGINSTWKRKWNSKHRTEAMIIYSDYAKNWSFAFVEKLPGFKYHREVHQHNNFNDLTIKFNHSWDIHPRYRLDIGSQWTQQLSTFNYQEIFIKEEAGIDTAEHITLPIEEEFQGFISSFYAENHLMPLDRLHLNFGLRYTRVASKEKNYLEPRLSLHYVPYKKWSFQLRWGQYRQFAHQVFYENELRVGENFWILNTHPDQPDLKTTLLSVGVHFNSDHFSFTGDLYQKRFSGLLGNSFEYNREIRDLEDLDVYRLYTEYDDQLLFVSGDGWANGLDLWLEYKMNPYTTWLAYSLSKVEYQFPGFNLGQRFPAPHDQRHTLKWTHFLSVNDWSLSANWTFHTGNPYSEVDLRSIVESIGTASNGQGQAPTETVYFLDIPNYNGRRFSNYHRLDISGSKRFRWGKNDKWEGKIGFSLYNVYNQINVQRKRYIPMQEIQGGLNIMETNHVEPGLTPNMFFQITW